MTQITNRITVSNRDFFGNRKVRLILGTGYRPVVGTVKSVGDLFVGVLKMGCGRTSKVEITAPSLNDFKVKAMELLLN